MVGGGCLVSRRHEGTIVSLESLSSRRVHLLTRYFSTTGCVPKNRVTTARPDLRPTTHVPRAATAQRTPLRRKRVPVANTRTWPHSRLARRAPRSVLAHNATPRKLLSHYFWYKLFALYSCSCWSGLLLPGGCHDLLLMPSRLLLPGKLSNLLRVSLRQILRCHKFLLRQLSLWAVSELGVAVKLQGLPRGTCHSLRLYKISS